MTPSKPSHGVKRSAPTSSVASPSGANSSKADKRQKRDENHASRDHHASTPTPAAAAAAAAAKDIGEHSNTQLTFAVDFLKAKRSPKPLQEILDHLTLQHLSEDQQRAFVYNLRNHSRVQFNPVPKSKGSSGQPPEWRTGTYEYRAKLPGVVSKVKLLEYLQQRKDQAGVSIKDIKDGWPDCEGPIVELMNEHKILVMRTKKDGYLRYVWLDMPELHHEVDKEFKLMWNQEPLPSVDEMPRKLKALGQKATSEAKSNVNLGQKAPPKRKKASRVQKKFENEHMRMIFEQHKRK
ncbi:transcription initiation factor IIE, beta subunit [Daldinia sp. FL1419]|nr:transcription initiation factor IIE, beta subunit [Daldinia sp. FL1419]